ncbi:MAG: hypothetical protein MUE82_10510 [Chloroflexi bacterium]|nr:hypothetical protein [Chloroflexota bacterium]
MIVVIGPLAYRPGPPGGTGEAAGLASGIAAAAAAAGAAVEVAARVGDDPAGDALLLVLARVKVGHTATLRDPTLRTLVVEGPEQDGEPLVPLADDKAAPGAAASGIPGVDGEGAGPPGSEAPAPLDAGDLDLALGYLLDARVVVVAQALGDAAAATVARHATFSDATVIAVVGPGTPVPDALDRAIVFERDEGAGEEFGTLVGRFAASLDAGAEAAEAFDAARAGLGWSPAAD